MSGYRVRGLRILAIPSAAESRRHHRRRSVPGGLHQQHDAETAEEQLAQEDERTVHGHRIPKGSVSHRQFFFTEKLPSGAYSVHYVYGPVEKSGR